MAQALECFPSKSEAPVQPEQKRRKGEIEEKRGIEKRREKERRERKEREKETKKEREKQKKEKTEGKRERGPNHGSKILDI
jgi:hypothetical protein